MTGDRLRDVLAVTTGSLGSVCHAQAGISELLLVPSLCTNPLLDPRTEPAALGGAWNSSVLPTALFLLSLLPKEPNFELSQEAFAGFPAQEKLQPLSSSF